MKKTLGSLAACLFLGSVSSASLAQPDLLTEPQMDAVSAGALPSFRFGSLLSVLDAQSASIRIRALAASPRHAPGTAKALLQVNSIVSGQSTSAGAKPVATTASLREVGTTASGNTLRAVATPMSSPFSRSSASSSIP